MVDIFRAASEPHPGEQAASNVLGDGCLAAKGFIKLI